ncbi:MAG: hypothetical protein M1830_005528 [Pleopsidium flavum]|nr:MAG: hypothetical protein M1830_005528 [Pleopsidium flavum]
MDLSSNDTSQSCSVFSSHGPQPRDIIVATLEIANNKPNDNTVDLIGLFNGKNVCLLKNATKEQCKALLNNEDRAIPARGKVVLGAFTLDIEALSGYLFLGFCSLIRPNDRANPSDLCASHNGCEIAVIKGQIYPETPKTRVQGRLIQHAEYLCQIWGTRHLWLVGERVGPMRVIWRNADLKDCKCVAEDRCHLSFPEHKVVLCKGIRPRNLLHPKKLNGNCTAATVELRPQTKAGKGVENSFLVDEYCMNRHEQARPSVEESSRSAKRPATFELNPDVRQPAKRVRSNLQQPDKVSMAVSRMIAEAMRCLGVLNGVAGGKTEEHVGKKQLEQLIERTEGTAKSWEEVSGYITAAFRGSVRGLRTRLELNNLEVPDVD